MKPLRGLAKILNRRAAAPEAGGTPPPPAARTDDRDDLIDVRSLIARYSAAEHIARADAYFASVTDDHKLLRKPFFGIPDTQANMHGIAAVLQRLRLFPGARVLDFGAGTGWLSRIFALLECRPIAVDVSAHALGLGRRAFARDPLTAALSVEWREYDGITLPADNDSVDRIVCYDSFHHVADQVAVLKEFHRVLVEGGIVAFHEPGPDHSRIPVSQYEMRHHDVIENDIVIEDIWATAQACGFMDLELSLTPPQSLSVSLPQFTRILADEATPDDISDALTCLRNGAVNLRIFSITKGKPLADSRFVGGLAGSFEMVFAESPTDRISGRAHVANTGATVWRPSIGDVGGVWLGVQIVEQAATRDFSRIWLSDSPVMPGEIVEVEFDIATPMERPVTLMFDLVAEFVTWFELIGSKPIVRRLEPPI